MIDIVHFPSTLHLIRKLESVADKGGWIDMEACFSQLTLDVVGKAVFNYDFEALRKDSELIQAVYTALKETEQRATDLFPFWKLPMSSWILPRQRKASKAVRIIRRVTEELIEKCQEIVARDSITPDFTDDNFDPSDPSILRFLLAGREEVSANQLRDDLLSMLVAGHETTASALTWTLYLLVQNPEKMQKCQEEANGVLQDRQRLTFDHYSKLKYISRCICESLRLYPHPPVLLRRAIKEDELPGGIKVPRKQNILLSIYNIHHSPEVWQNPEAFIPERFSMDGPLPNETSTDFKFIPFSGGPRKCIGDQFAMMEAVIALAGIIRNFEFELVPNQTIGLTTGATIHTTEGLYMTVKKRSFNVNL